MRLSAAFPQHYDPLRAAFYVNWDSNSLASLELHYHDIDLLIPEELHAFTPDGTLVVDKDPKLDAWLKTLNVELPMMPLLNNYDGSVWQVEPMAKCSRVRIRANASSHLLSPTPNLIKIAGIAVDFEEVPDDSQKDFERFHSRAGRCSALRQAETHGRSSCRRLDLRLQISRRRFRRHHSHELRFSLAAVCRRSHRRSKLVPQKSSPDFQDGPAAENRHGHRQLRL